MAHNTSISLGEHFQSFIGAQVKTGKYGSVSDVVRAGLRLLEEHEAKVQNLQNSLIAGENSGAVKAFDSTAFLKKMHNKHVK